MKNEFMNTVEILKSNELMSNLDVLAQQKDIIYRCQPDKGFFIIPSALRQDIIQERLRKFPATKFYEQWCSGKEFRELIPPPFPKEYIHSLHVRRIKELAFYTIHYNYFLAKHVHENQDKFDDKTLKMHELRPPSFLENRETFFYLFRYMFNLSIARETLNGDILNYSVINEEFAAYDESLPQHYDTQTAAVDFTKNPYKAIYFALKKIPSRATHFSIYAYKQIQDSEKNPIIIQPGNLECKNLRIIRQEGLFIRFRYACLYYFVHGKWPSVEDYIPLSANAFELIKFNVPVTESRELRHILNEEGITDSYMLPDLAEAVS